MVVHLEITTAAAAVDDPKVKVGLHISAVVIRDQTRFHFHGSSRRSGRFRPRRTPLPWQEKGSSSAMFNASAHEVPSGPNPISNR
ncbi:unnamed protein product [Linum trigynum]|uniref:Uncharacterized protein n=1 Tax=Linum trigynum TaxID=586398 RepID=A0AAV2FXB0_9ROSI